MPRESSYFFETTVFSADVPAEALLLSLPASVIAHSPAAAERFRDDPVSLAADALGVQVGVRIPSAEDIAEVFFASLAGRVAPFDEFSFERWRRQRLERAADPRARFAAEIASTEFIVVQESPLSGGSMGSLAARGAAYTIAGWDAFAGHPLTGLGVLVVGEFGLVVAQVGRAFADEIYVIARYRARRLRRLFGVPEDWEP